MPGSSDNALQVYYESRARTIVERLPLRGALPRIEAAPGLRDRRGEVHAGAFLREGRIAFNCTRAEFPRIFIHEIFHFAWARAGNPARWSYEALLRGEIAGGARGELGWSAEWRKLALRRNDIDSRTRVWREYCCESFCDTAAWIYAGSGDHREFTLAVRFRDRRRRWFLETIETTPISI